VEDDMKLVLVKPIRPRRISKLFAVSVAIVLLPPFVALALAPMLLMLVPVAMVGIPFILPAMLSGSLAARADERRRTSLKPLRRPLVVVR
jgi:hypothetical protein